jgi:Gas vesicle protein G
MGLISGLLTLPLAPVRGTVWLAEQLTEEAERQLYDEDRIMRELFELELREEAGDIDARTREELEDELLERLTVARERRRLDDRGGGEDGR